MITTGCDGCCFLKKDGDNKGCVVQQLCVTEDDKVFAPGYCSLCRSHKWAKKQDTTDVTKLYEIVIKERVLKFDMLVFFDESIHNIKMLERTLDSDWYVPYANKIIIVDTTGFGDRKNIALQYLKNKKHKVPTIVDSSVVNESTEERDITIRRISKQVSAPFFLTIPAGNILGNLDAVAKRVQHVPSRVIHWFFPFRVGLTAIVPNKFHYGLFITIPYLSLTKSPEFESFAKQLRKEEIETEMGLSWFCTDCWLK